MTGLRRSTALPALPSLLLALNLTVSTVSVAISTGREPAFDTVLYALNAVALGVAGFLISWFRPGHRIGLLLTATGSVAAWVELLEGYAYHLAWPAAGAALWTATWGSFLGIGATLILPAVFPTGRSLSPSWRPVVRIGLAGTVLTVVGTAFGPPLAVRFPGGVNPYAMAGPLPEIAFVAGQIAVLLALLGGLVSMSVRYRGAGPEERLQLKWLVYVLCLLAVTAPTALFFYDAYEPVQWAIAVTVPLIPLAVCVAVLRYRLYDIEVVISRTLVYAALSAVLATSWLATAWGLGAVVGGRYPSWVTVTATVIACAVVQPVRRRLQDLVDRRFRRARHDALAMIDTYLEDLRTGQVTPEDLERVLQEVLDRNDIRLHYLIAGVAGPPEVSGTTRSTVSRGGVELALVEHQGVTPPLLPDVLARSGLAIEIARLRAEVEHQLAEVSRSRERIVAAGYEERRRLERDLHDGAQQRLVAVGLALRHAQHRLGPGDPVGAGLDEAVAEITAAIQELREIARGARPSGLDGGLAVALRELAGRTPLPVQLEAAAGRFPAPIEACAYYVASEALTNAVKHSRAGAVQVQARQSGGDLMVHIADDGVGGAEPALGSGLRGLGDRVASHGGTLEIVSPRGGGTTVTVRLPCGS